MCKIIEKIKKVVRNNMTDKEIGQNKVRKIINENIKNPKIYSLDRNYEVPTKNELKKVLKENIIDKKHYIPDMYDCENFAFHLMSALALYYEINAFGVVLSYDSKHSFNIAIVREDDEYKLYKVEPQEDKMWEVEYPEKERYITKDEIILI